MKLFYIYTQHPDSVARTTHGDFELFHSTTGDCLEPLACKTCKFYTALQLDTCCLSHNDERYQPIYDFFKLNHPEKLL